MLLYVKGEELVVDAAGQVALEAADDLELGFAFGEASLHVGLGFGVVVEADDDGAVEGGVGGPVAAAVEADLEFPRFPGQVGLGAG